MMRSIPEKNAGSGLEVSASAGRLPVKQSTSYLQWQLRDGAFPSRRGFAGVGRKHLLEHEPDVSHLSTMPAA